MVVWRVGEGKILHHVEKVSSQRTETEKIYVTPQKNPHFLQR